MIFCRRHAIIACRHFATFCHFHYFRFVAFLSLLASFHALFHCAITPLLLFSPFMPLFSPFFRFDIFFIITFAADMLILPLRHFAFAISLHAITPLSLLRHFLLFDIAAAFIFAADISPPFTPPLITIISFRHYFVIIIFAFAILMPLFRRHFFITPLLTMPCRWLPCHYFHFSFRYFLSLFSISLSIISLFLIITLFSPCRWLISLRH